MECTPLFTATNAVSELRQEIIHRAHDCSAVPSLASQLYTVSDKRRPEAATTMIKRSL